MKHKSAKGQNSELHNKQPYAVEVNQEHAVLTCSGVGMLTNVPLRGKLCLHTAPTTPWMSRALFPTAVSRAQDKLVPQVGPKSGVMLSLSCLLRWFSSTAVLGSEKKVLCSGLRSVWAVAQFAWWWSLTTASAAAAIRGCGTIVPM